MVFLGDGRIVDEMEQPSAEAVLERMKRFDVIRSKFEGDGAPSDGVTGADVPLDTLDTFDKD